MAVPAAWALQQALIVRLKASQALRTALGGDRVFDAVPSRPAYPYIALGTHTLRDFSSGDSFGQEHTLTFTAYSRSPGFREAYSLADLVSRILTAPALSLTGHQLILLRFVSTDIRRESDALTSRATITFRAISEPNI